MLFGATGDLSRRKLLPGLAHLALSALTPDIQVVATSLEDMSEEEFRGFAKQAVDGVQPPPADAGAVGTFAEQADVRPPSRPGRPRWRRRSRQARTKLGGPSRRLHYLSVPPAAAPAVITMLREAANLVERSRVIMEKPFGTDLESAITLNDKVHETFRERQIFRIDHFLGKEAAQNILAFRFANGLFEPIWNRNFIDHIQIDIPETLGLDRRAGFYEATGAYKDMVVTHLFQVLAFVAMEPPTALEPRAISEEKNKVFRSMLPLDPDKVVRGQYSGYRERGRGRPRLRHRDLHRAQGRDRQLAMGRRSVLLPDRKEDGRGAADHLDRVQGGAEGDVPGRVRGRLAGPDHLTFDLADESKVSLSFYGKRPGPGDETRQAEHAVLHPGDRPGRRHPRGLRAADHGRDARRSHAVHHRRGHREPVGAVEPLLQIRRR